MGSRPKTSPVSAHIMNSRQSGLTLNWAFHAPLLRFIFTYPGLIMRCLVVADLHYALPQFDWLLSAGSQFDVVIFAGDALDLGSMVDYHAQILVVRKYLERLAGVTKVMLCSGNHDLDERNAAG